MGAKGSKVKRAAPSSSKGILRRGKREEREQGGRGNKRKRNKRCEEKNEKGRGRKRRIFPFYFSHCLCLLLCLLCLFVCLLCLLCLFFLAYGANQAEINLAEKQWRENQWTVKTHISLDEVGKYLRVSQTIYLFLLLLLSYSSYCCC